jgi:hypothetical protein
MTKIVFLDFDGVLLPDPDAREQANQGLNTSNYLQKVVFNPICVANLNHLLQTTHAEIVLSTSWADGHSISELSHCLMRNGIDPSCIFEYDDPGESNYMTPRSTISNRGQEIQNWINNHPEISSWVAIDDNAAILYLKSNYVRTHPDHGFNKQCLEKAQTILNA